MAYATFHRGKQMCYDGDYGPGLELINQALEIRPRDLQFLSFKAYFLQENRKYREAVDIADRVLKFRPKDVWANNVVFKSSLIIGDTSRCQRSLTKMKACRAKMAKSMMRIPEKENLLDEILVRKQNMKALFDEDQLERTVQEAEKCLQMAKYDSEILYLKLAVFTKQRRFRDILNTFETLRPVFPEMIDVGKLAELAGCAHYLMGNILSAVEVLQAFASPRNMERAEIFIELGKLKKAAEDSIGNGQWEDAVSSLDRALDLIQWTTPPNPDLESELASLRRLTVEENSNASLAENLSALGTDPYNFDLLERVADFYVKAEDFKNARKFLRRLVQVSKTLPQNLTSASRHQEWETKFQIVQKVEQILSRTDTNWSVKRVIRILSDSKDRTHNEFTKSQLMKKYKVLATKYHPDKHTGEPPEWQKVYHIVMQEITAAKKYLQEHLLVENLKVARTSSSSGIWMNFRWTEEQMRCNEMAKAEAAKREQRKRDRANRAAGVH